VIFQLTFTRAAIRRHSRCDWGEADHVTAAENDANLRSGKGRAKSRYQDSGGKSFHIVTESDRSGTTIMLPKEYSRVCANLD
jgi:hypothetical protein